jgi:hypothetical protein
LLLLAAVAAVEQQAAAHTQVVAVVALAAIGLVQVPLVLGRTHLRLALVAQAVSSMALLVDPLAAKAVILSSLLLLLLVADVL